jgi:hypothetical protein
VLAGDVQFIVVANTVIPMVEGKRVRVLGVFGSKKVKGHEERPTLKELDFATVDDCPIAVVGPKGMDAAVAAKLEAALRIAVGTPLLQAPPTRWACHWSSSVAVSSPRDWVPPASEPFGPTDPENLQPIPDEAGRLQPYPTYSYSVHVAEVEIDLETGFTKLRRLSAFTTAAWSSTSRSWRRSSKGPSPWVSAWP